ncbi:hypothetical protein ACFL2V_04175, partial [Pseudomonadota bacterium]
MNNRTLNRTPWGLLAGAGVVIGALSGCGGGGATGVAALDDTTTSDNVAPAVASMTPADGETVSFDALTNVATFTPSTH